MGDLTGFQQEWVALQKSIDQYEMYALVLKMLAVIVFFAGLVFSVALLWLVFVVFVLWLQEAIWKTFQSRAEQRMLRIESAIKQESGDVAFQFYAEWEGLRPGFMGLVKVYLRQACRPTVAYPYVVLVMACLLLWVDF